MLAIILVGLSVIRPIADIEEADTMYTKYSNENLVFLMSFVFK